MSIEIYIGTTVCYPTQISVSGKLKKKDLEYHTAVLHDKINLSIKMNLYFSIYNTGSFLWKFKSRKLISCLDAK